MHQLSAVIWTVVALMTFPSGAEAHPASPALPAPITLSGIAGVTPWMAIGVIRRHWRIRVPYYQSTSGTSLRGTAIVCGGAMRGVASFFSDSLQYVWWTQGARTDKGVGIGSTPAQLRAAYGQDLLQGGAYNDLYVVDSSSTPPVMAIHFILESRGGQKARVYYVLWGAQGEIASSHTIAGDSPFSVDC